MEGQPAPSDNKYLYVFGLPLGGLLLGTGIVNLYYSFGWDGGPMGQNFSGVGFSGVDNIGLLPSAEFSIPLVVMGVLILVGLNATAWRQTGGY